eukprot:1923979-Amphidinium_carterae.1
MREDKHCQGKTLSHVVREDLKGLNGERCGEAAIWKEAILLGFGREKLGFGKTLKTRCIAGSRAPLP